MDEKVFQSIERCVRWLMPFAAWRMPDAESVSFCAAPSLMADPNRKADGKGFFISQFAHPFAEASWIPFEIGADEVLSMENPTQSLPQLPSESTNKSDYISRLASLIGRLKDRGYAKTVISTVTTTNIPQTRPVDIAKHLFDNAKGLFCNCWYHPRLGLWMGATPELLLSVRGDKLRSVALAGTTAVGHDWDVKNKAEHQFVVDYIADALAMHSANVSISSTYDVNFGQLKHLRTDFNADLTPNTDVADLIDALNPTPALCGYPKQQALSDIAEIESHQRKCYGGLVGVANDTSLDAFVNIRCVCLGAGQCKSYSGGGITADSEPEAEWAEAQAKRLQLMHFLNLD